MTLTSMIVTWAGLAAVVLSMILVRKWAARREDDTLHLHEFDTAVVQRQSSLATFLNRIDLAGKSLTVLVVLYGLTIVGRFIYMAWMDSLRIHMQ